MLIALTIFSLQNEDVAFFDYKDDQSNEDLAKEKKKTTSKYVFQDDSEDSDNAEIAETRALIQKLSPMKKKKAGSSDEPIMLGDSPVKKGAQKEVKTKKKGTAAKSKKEDSKQAKISFAKAGTNDKVFFYYSLY